MRIRIAPFLVAAVVIPSLAATVQAGPGADGSGAAQVRQSRPVTLKLQEKGAPGALGIFLKLDGIAGTSSAAGHEDEIPVLSFTDGVITPRDAARGTVSGRPQYEPLVIVKAVDRATPSILGTLLAGRQLSTVELSVYGASGATYRIRLQHAWIVAVKQRPASEEAPNPVEEISISFQSIQWTWTDSSGTATAEGSLSGTV